MMYANGNAFNWSIECQMTAVGIFCHCTYSLAIIFSWQKNLIIMAAKIADAIRFLVAQSASYLENYCLGLVE